MSIEPRERVKLQKHSIGFLAYTDDQEKAALKVKLHINEDKMEYMVVGRRNTIGLYSSLSVNNNNNRIFKKSNNSST